MGSCRTRKAFVKEAGNVAPALEEVDEGNESGEEQEDPPSNRAHEILELLPAGVVGVTDYLPGSGPVEAVVVFFSTGFRSVIRTEEEIEAIHPDGGISYVSILDIKINLFGFEGLAVHHATEVDPVTPAAAAIAIGSEEDMFAPSGECGLDVVFL